MAFHFGQNVFISLKCPNSIHHHHLSLTLHMKPHTHTCIQREGGSLENEKQDVVVDGDKDAEDAGCWPPLPLCITSEHHAQKQVGEKIFFSFLYSFFYEFLYPPLRNSESLNFL